MMSTHNDLVVAASSYHHVGQRGQIKRYQLRPREIFDNAILYVSSVLKIGIGAGIKSVM